MAQQHSEHNYLLGSAPSSPIGTGDCDAVYSQKKKCYVYESIARTFYTCCT